MRCGLFSQDYWVAFSGGGYQQLEIDDGTPVSTLNEAHTYLTIKAGLYELLHGPVAVRTTPLNKTNKSIKIPAGELARAGKWFKFAEMRQLYNFDAKEEFTLTKTEAEILGIK